MAISDILIFINGYGLDAGGPGWLIRLIETLCGIALLIGFLTPLASVAAAFGYLAISTIGIQASGLSDKSLVATLLAVMSIALLLLGPGAYSADARLFGRRYIVIPETPRPPL